MTKHILIIDDDKDVLEIFKDILINAGYTVTTLTEIEDIVEAIEIYNPDLVIIDYLLQGINGGEMCEQIKKNKQTLHVPVILISAHSRVLMSLGTYHCDEFIEKPSDISHLTERVKYHLKRSAPRNRHRGYVKVELNKRGDIKMK